MIESSEFAQAQSLLSNGLDPDLLLVESTAAGPSETVQFRQLIMAAPKHRTCLILGIGEQSLRKEASELGIKHLWAFLCGRGWRQRRFASPGECGVHDQ
jgi:hypothetical protein